MKIETVAPSEWNGRLLSSWDALLGEASEPSVFLTPEWILPWWRFYGSGRKPRLIAAWDEEGRLCGLAPMYTRRLGPAGFHGPRLFSLIGDEDVGSEYLGFLLRAGKEGAVLAALADHLRGEWHLLDLRGVREGGPVIRLLPDFFGVPATGRFHSERHPCSEIPLPGDYDKYVASLPQKFRTSFRQRTNKVLKNFSVRMIRTGGVEELDEHLERFYALHQTRWKAAGAPGSFYDPRMRSFYREVAGGFLRRGWLRFYHLEVDSVIRASQFGFAFGGVLHSLQESFDHDFRPEGVSGLGVVLRGMAIRACIEEGLTGYDFLGGEEDFKTRWQTVTRYVQRIRIGAPGPAGGIAFAATAGWRKFKDRARSLAPPWAVEARRWIYRRRMLRRAERIGSSAEREQG